MNLVEFMSGEDEIKFEFNPYLRGLVDKCDTIAYQQSENFNGHYNLDILCTEYTMAVSFAIEQLYIEKGGVAPVAFKSALSNIFIKNMYARLVKVFPKTKRFNLRMTNFFRRKWYARQIKNGASLIETMELANYLYELDAQTYKNKQKPFVSISDIKKYESKINKAQVLSKTNSREIAQQLLELAQNMLNNIEFKCETKLPIDVGLIIKKVSIATVLFIVFLSVLFGVIYATNKKTETNVAKKHEVTQTSFEDKEYNELVQHAYNSYKYNKEDFDELALEIAQIDTKPVDTVKAEIKEKFEQARLPIVRNLYNAKKSNNTQEYNQLKLKYIKDYFHDSESELDTVLEQYAQNE